MYVIVLLKILSISWIILMEENVSKRIIIIFVLCVFLLLFHSLDQFLWFYFVIITFHCHTHLSILNMSTYPSLPPSLPPLPPLLPSLSLCSSIFLSLPPFLSFYLSLYLSLPLSFSSSLNRSEEYGHVNESGEVDT